MNLHTPVIDNHGIVAEHDYACPVCLKRHAVFNCNTGRFAPCWLCRRDGWEVRKLPWWRRLLRRKV